MRILIFVLSLLACAQAQAASLRTMTMLHGPSVYLRDLFDDAGPNADRVLGPGPDPGGRIIIEAAQLSAIARQFGVAWQSVSRADRAVMEWPGRPLRRDETIEAIRAAMTAHGAADDMDIDIAGFNSPIIPTEATPAITASQLDYDSSTGRFTCALTVISERMNPIETRVSGRVDEVVEAPVAVTRLLPETVLRPDDFRLARVRAAGLQSEVARSADQIVGMQLRRPVAAGQPLRLADLSRPPLVRRGATVQIELSSAGLIVTGQAVAIDAGAEGDKVRIQNLTSRAYLFADVIGPGRVRVTPGSPALASIPARLNQRLN